MQPSAGSYIIVHSNSTITYNVWLYLKLLTALIIMNVNTAQDKQEKVYFRGNLKWTDSNYAL